MELTDIAPIDAWEQLENEAVKKFNLQSAVFNAEGIRITGTKNFSNDLCPKIKSTDKGQAFICAAAHMNMAGEAQNTGQAVIEECDAGLAKIVVPIFSKGSFLGTAGGCGVLIEGGSVDSFAIHKLTDIKEAAIKKLGQDIPMVSAEKFEKITAFFTQKIDEIVSQYE